MTIILKKNASGADIDNVIRALKNSGKKGFNAKKYSGILKLKTDPIKTQRALRNEWR
jgi:hypothetical protein